MEEAEKRGLKRMKELMDQKMQNLEEEFLNRQKAQENVEEKAEGLASKLKGFIYKLILPALFYRGIQNEMRSKRLQTRKEYNEVFPLMVDFCYRSMIQLMKRFANPLWEEESSIHCIKQNTLLSQYSGEKAATGGEMDSRCDKIHLYCKKIIDGLADNVSEEYYSPFLLRFLGKYIHDGNYLTGDFHVEFELNRLEFNSWGGLK